MTDDYTPTTDEVREIYASDPFNGVPGHAFAEFDRWYAAEKAKWQAEAAELMADEARRTGRRLTALEVSDVLDPQGEAMNPFIETAAEALWDDRRDHSEDPPWGDPELHAKFEQSHRDTARKILASLVQHRDDIARVLTEHRLTGAWDSTTCGCGHEYGGPTGPRDLDAHKADAVLAAITGSES